MNRAGPQRARVPAAIGAPATVVLLAALASCSAPPPTPDVVLITLDTLRADRLGAYGNPDGLTPNLDRLASGAIVFEDVTAPTPITLPSHATLFTGRNPTSTGVRSNGTFVLPDDETTMAEVLRERGYATGAVVAAYPLHRRYGLDQGFETYDDHLPALPDRSGTGVPFFYSERTADDVTDRALAIWKSFRPGPRFLWVHYFDPHAPYTPPERFIGETAKPRYDGEVAFMDEQIGRLLEVIAADAPDAMIVVTADHGESLGEHGEDTHGVFLYQSTLQVPLIVRAPGHSGDRQRRSRPVGLVDVLPTLAGLLDVDVPDGVEGVDLLSESTPEEPEPIYAESLLPRLQYRFSDLAALRVGGLKYIDAPLPELYDLEQDPSERDNLHGSHPGEAAVREALERFRRDADPDTDAQAGETLDAEAVARLRSLGYTASASGLAVDAPRGRDPKSMTEWIRRHNRAMRRISDGDVDEGARLLRELIEEAPENDVARFQLAGALLAGSRPEAAESELRAVLERDPDYFEAHRMLGEVLGELGELDEALTHFRRAAALRPSLAGPHFGMGALYESYGRFEEAAAAYVEGIRAEPSRPELTRALVRLRRSRGELERVRGELETLARERPEAVPLWLALSRVQLLSGDPDGAEVSVRRALEIDPGQPRANVLAGDLALARGDAQAAERAYLLAVASQSDDPGLLLGLARARIALRSEDAEPTLRRVTERFPRYAPGHVALGRFLEDRGDRGGAADAYRRALEVRPGDGEARAGLSRVAPLH